MPGLMDREAEADKDSQQGQRGARQDAEIAPHVFIQGKHSVAKEVADVNCKDKSTNDKTSTRSGKFIRFMVCEFLTQQTKHSGPLSLRNKHCPFPLKEVPFDDPRECMTS